MNRSNVDFCVGPCVWWIAHEDSTIKKYNTRDSEAYQLSAKIGGIALSRSRVQNRGPECKKMIGTTFVFELDDEPTGYQARQLEEEEELDEDL